MTRKAKVRVIGNSSRTAIPKTILERFQLAEGNNGILITLFYPTLPFT